MKMLFLRLWNSPTFTSWGNLAVSALSLLLTMPLLLTRFPANEIAVWFLFANIITFVHMADIGFTPTFVRLTAFVMGGAEDLSDFRNTNKNKGTGQVNWNMMEKLYGNINYVYLVTTAAVFLIAITFGTFALKKPIAGVHNQKEMWTLWTMVVVALTISFYGKKYEALLQGMNYIAVVNRINILIGLSSVVCSFIVLLLGYSIVVLGIVTNFFLITTAVRGWLILRQVENKRFRKFKYFSFDKKIFMSAWNPSWRSALVILGSTGVSQATGLMYAQIGDAKSLAAYLFAYKLINTVSDISKAPYYSKTPYFSRLRAEGKILELSSSTARAMFISLLVFATLGLGVIILGPWLLNVIHSKIVMIDSKIWVFMLLVWFLERHHAMHAQIYSTTNHIPFYIPIIITGIINILLATYLLPLIGIWAFPASQGASNLLINNWWNVKISLKSINQSFFSYYKIMFSQFKLRIH